MILKGFRFGCFSEKNKLVNLHGIVIFIPLHGILKVSQKMKKVFALLTIVSVLSFVACKNNTKKDGHGDSAQTEQEAADQNEAENAEANAQAEANADENTDATADSNATETPAAEGDEAKTEEAPATEEKAAE